MGEITISVKEYKELLETAVRVKVFEEFVNSEKYSISREECGKYLGFKVVKVEEYGC